MERAALIAVAMSTAGGGAVAQGSPPAAAVDTQRIEVVTRHTLRIEGRTLEYLATASETLLRDERGRVAASIFSVAYTAAGAAADPHRPVAFVFNGGPGSSAVWLHLGAFGPLRVDVPSDAGDPGPPPLRMVSNPLSLLAVADLVFIDPVGTGYSRARGSRADSLYWGFEEDAASTVDFIRTWITEHGRWNAPQYLIGESYGTIRAVAVAERMQRTYVGLAPAGLVLVAPALDLQTFVFGPRNLLPYVLFLPSYAAAAWHHEALPDMPDGRDAFLDEVSRFALRDYAPALIMGSALDPAARDHLLDALARYTGLDRAYWDRADLRVPSSRFLKELLRRRGQVVGRLDSRYVGEEADALADAIATDPASYTIDDAFIVMLHEYLRDSLGVSTNQSYQVLNRQANRQWRRPAGTTGFFSGHVSLTGLLGRVAAENPSLRVLIAAGLYDLTTPFASAHYMARQSGMDSSRIAVRVYDAGHMMYNHGPSFRRLSEDVRRFVADAVRSVRP